MLEQEQKETEGIIVEIPVAETDPKSDPKEGQTEQGKSEEGKGDVYEIPEKFKGKSVAEVSKSYSELEKTHGNMANEVGSLRSEIAELKKALAKSGNEELMKKVNPEHIEKEIADLKKKLDDDFVDDDDASKINKQIKSLENKLVDVMVQKRLNDQLASVKNPEALNSFKKEFVETDFNDEQFNSIYDFAKDHLSDDTGIVSASDLHAAAFKLYGDAYKVALEAKTEKKIRQNLQHVEDIKTTSITSGEKKANKVDITKLSPIERKSILRNLSNEELEKVIQQSQELIRRG